MLIGVCQIVLLIPGSDSLKGKRFILSGLKKRIRNKFNVSVSETDEQDNHKCSNIGVAMVGTDRQYVNSSLSSLINSFRLFPQIELVDYELDLI